jgi:hypothetical protein
MQIENWKEINNCSGYFISDLGRVRGKRGNIIKLQQYKGHGRYWFFRMPHMNYTKSIHRLVAEHFLDNPNNYPEVNHKFGNKDDNRSCVLEWCTRLQNMQHAHKTGLKVNKGSRKIFDNTTFSIIKECFSRKYTNVSIAKYFGCDQSTIAYIRQGARQYYPL